jgi:hypothetical protein
MKQRKNWDRIRQKNWIYRKGYIMKIFEVIAEIEGYSKEGGGKVIICVNI